MVKLIELREAQCAPWKAVTDSFNSPIANTPIYSCFRLHVGQRCILYIKERVKSLVCHQWIGCCFFSPASYKALLVNILLYKLCAKSSCSTVTILTYHITQSDNCSQAHCILICQKLVFTESPYPNQLYFLENKQNIVYIGTTFQDRRAPRRPIKLGIHHSYNNWQLAAIFWAIPQALLKDRLAAKSFFQILSVKKKLTSMPVQSSKPRASVWTFHFRIQSCLFLAIYHVLCWHLSNLINLPWSVCLAQECQSLCRQKIMSIFPHRDCFVTWRVH